MKNYLNGVIEREKAELKQLKERSDASQDLAEVRSIGQSMEAARGRLSEAEAQLRALEQKGHDSALNPVATYSQITQVETTVRSENMYASMEYRQAFKDYVQRGVAIPAEYRAGGDLGTTVTADIGMIVPETILNEFIKEVSKVYGQVYAKVRKLNIKGGVKIPISQLSANFHWITETTVSSRQKAGDIKEYIEFSYNIGEIRVAQTLLSQIVSLDMFEQEIVRIMVEAYVKTMDNCILNGTGIGQPLGIFNDPRVTNVITLTSEEFADWTAWRKKLFAKVPLSKRGQGEFLFTPATVEANLLTMKDGNDRPLFREATDLSMGNTAGSFFGRSVTLVEPDVVKDLDLASAGDVVGVFWTPNDYAINTQMSFGMKRWFDEEKNEWVNKGIVILDGKIIDPSGCYLIKKGA
jgi:HK97 family phage major capsid protein